MTVCLSFNGQICRIKKGSQAGHHLKLTREMISRHCYKVKTVTSFVLLRFSFSMNHFILLVRAPPALSFKHILSDWCNCTMTGAIPHPHQSFLWRYGLHPNMTTPILLHPFPLSLPPCFTVRVINKHIQCSAPFVQPRFPGQHPIRAGPEPQCNE